MHPELFGAPGRLEKSLDYLHWSHVAGAVLDVFRANQRNDAAPGGTKSSADEWAIHSGLRRAVWDRTRTAWCERTGLGWTAFPYSEDCVARLYFRFRKRNEEELRGFEREIGEAKP
jgi:hypothetical protein